LSVYPAGVKQARILKLVANDGKTSLIASPCVVKSLSFRPLDEFSQQVVNTCIALYVYDGDTVIMKFPFIGSQYLSTNVAILIPADGLKINTSLSFEVEKLDGPVDIRSTGVTSLRVAYQQ
jgi:hypothetical protein